jgi:hypothetical protein
MWRPAFEAFILSRAHAQSSQIEKFHAGVSLPEIKIDKPVTPARQIFICRKQLLAYQIHIPGGSLILRQYQRREFGDFLGDINKLRKNIKLIHWIWHRFTFLQTQLVLIPCRQVIYQQPATGPCKNWLIIY